MAKKTCTRYISFCAGHRVMGHENKCAQIHGHNYRVEATAYSENLDAVGRVIDFAVIKEKLGVWIDQNWDHGFLAAEADGDVIKAIASIPNHKLFILPVNPTAENMCQYLLEEICPLLFKDTGVTITKIVLHETENCFAEAVL